MSEPTWLKEPDPSGNAIVYVSIPEGHKSTPELAEALMNLARALQDLNKEKHLNKKKGPCPALWSCDLFGCEPWSTRPCANFSTCVICPSVFGLP
jgi:hypothetical protein